MKKNKTNPSIKKPRFVLTDETRLYLATKELSEESPDGLFFIVSLFWPVKQGAQPAVPRTEVATFDDAESAVIYRETVAAMCRANAKSAFAEMCKDFIEKFNSK